jgi:Na+/melibiose symporter-like transporter
MRKEFPVNKWLRKHMTPLRTVAAIVMYMIVIIVAPKYISLAAYRTVMMSLIYGFMGVILPTMIWWIFWEVKNRYQPEFCKECGRTLPEKFED